MTIGTRPTLRRRIAVATLAAGLATTDTPARADPTTIAAGLQLVSTAMQMMSGSAREEDVSLRLIKQNYELSVELHQRFDAFADGLVAVLMQVNRLPDQMREDIEAGFDQHQRDTLRGVIQVVKERLASIARKIEADTQPDEEDWDGLVRAQRLLQEASRILAQKDDRNLAVLLEALSWEWTVHKARRNREELQEMKTFYRKRLAEMRDPTRNASIEARKLRGATALDQELENVEKTVESLRAGYEAERPDWIDEANRGLRYCDFASVAVFRRDEGAWAKGKRLEKAMSGPLKARMEGEIDLCGLHAGMLDAVGTALEKLGVAQPGEDLEGARLGICSPAWLADRRKRLAEVSATVESWRGIKPGKYEVQRLPNADMRRCGPDGTDYLEDYRWKEIQ